MKLISPGVILYFICVVAGTAQTQQSTLTEIIGTWRHSTFHYIFGETGIMSEIQVENEPVMYNAYYYESVPDTSPPLIRYGKDLADSTSCSYLLVADIKDSTATIAYGTPFARGSEGTGLRGTWTYADNLTIITWEFGTDTVSYTEQVLNTENGIFVIAEQHNGTFTRGKREDRGRFFLTFDDGSIATVYPLIARDIMYLFDLTGRRSKFVRTDEAPAYSEYREVSAQKDLNGILTR